MDARSTVPTNSRVPEDRQFRMHPELLWSVIEAQAGTVEKALLEGVMNAVDAGASSVDIRLNPESFEISDNGRGFGSRAEIEQFFEVFGTPHQEGDATYGRFRMGRGQLFSFASTVWRSSTHQMTVDIKTNGLSYKLEETPDSYPGCEINGTWYSRLGDDDLHRLKAELRLLCAWMQIDVHSNGECISKRVDDAEWDIETEDAFIKFGGSGGLAVYNLGALVRVYGADRFGVSGTVVSKKQLQINFARNDILVNKCGVWRRVREILKSKWGELARLRKLDDSQRHALIQAILSKEFPLELALKARLLIDATGKQRSIADLTPYKGINDTLSVCLVDRRDSRRGERVMQSGLGLALMDHCMIPWGVYKLEPFYRLLQSLGYDGYFKWTTLDELAPHISSKYKIIDNCGLPKHLGALLVGIQAAADTIAWQIFMRTKEDRDWSTDALGSPKCRRVVLGESDSALAWTDGCTYIAVNINVAKSVLAYGPSAFDVATLLLHEYCHDSPDEQEHEHGHDFFELFHDTIMRDSAFHDMRHVARHLVAGYKRAVKEMGIRQKAWVSKAEYELHELDPLNNLGRENSMLRAIRLFPIGAEDATEISVAASVIGYAMNGADLNK